MKLLINKKTGKIINIKDLLTDEFIFDLFSKDFNYFITKLYKIAEEWEDYEEPKEHYFITEYGEVYSLNEYEDLNNVANPEDYKAIGNYFVTQEEAEKAVEKLKALKRLLNKGFKFGGFYYTEMRDYASVNIEATMINDNVDSDLELIFGGE